MRRVFSTRKLWCWLSFRLLAVTCLLLVLAGAKIVLAPKDNATIFLVDTSLSVQAQQSVIEDYINEQLSFKGRKDQVGVIVFGRKPMVDIPLKKDLISAELTAQPNPYFTDIEKAVEFALDTFPENANRRLVLITDGKENTGNAALLKEKLNSSKVNLLVYSLESGDEQDVQLSSLEIPSNIHAGEKVPVKFIIESTVKSTGSMHLFFGGDVLKEEATVEPGSNDFTFYITMKEKGRVDCQGEIDFSFDTNSQNNTLTTTVLVEDNPQVLVVGDKKDATALNSLLESLGISYHHYLPEETAGNLNFLSRFAEVFLVNVSHDRLQPEFETNLAQCVRELGTGLVVIGGENSFAPGGYEHTLLEEMLPVRCRMKGNKKQPNLGLVLVIDCSGSMEDESGGVKKIEMAKEAALRTVDILESDDYLGVLGFADTLEWVVPFGKVDDKEAIKKSIGRLSSRGGTLIIPALDHTINTLNEAPAKIKHMILLTDGQGEQEGFDTCALAMKENSITLSSVAVGHDADRQVLEYLGDYTGGRNYYASDFHSVPSIFTRETYLAAKKYLNNEEFTPVQVEEREFFPYRPFPLLKGYVGTGIKDDADLILKSHLDDPVLAAWNYGLGKVVVWTPDLNGYWSDPWIHWEGFQQQWSHLINGCLSSQNGDMIKLQLTREGGEIRIFASVLDQKPGAQLEMIMQTDQEAAKEIILEQVAPGKYSGDFSIDKVGDYVFTARLKDHDELICSATRIIHVDYSPEYALDALNDYDNTKAIAVMTGGHVINKETNIFEEPLIKNSAEVNLDFILLPLGLVFVILDIAVRKLDWFN